MNAAQSWLFQKSAKKTGDFHIHGDRLFIFL